MINQGPLEKVVARWLCKVSKNLVLLMKGVLQKATVAMEP